MPCNAVLTLWTWVNALRAAAEFKRCCSIKHGRFDSLAHAMCSKDAGCSADSSGQLHLSSTKAIVPSCPLQSCNKVAPGLEDLIAKQKLSSSPTKLLTAAPSQIIVVRPSTTALHLPQHYSWNSLIMARTLSTARMRPSTTHQWC